MTIILDTSMLLLAVAGRSLLPRKVVAELRDPDNAIVFSSASIWEIAIKFAMQQPGFQTRPETVLEMALDIGLTEHPVTGALASRVADLPHHHADPFDRLILALALSLPGRLYTTDRRLPIYSDLVFLVR